MVNDPPAPAPVDGALPGRAAAIGGGVGFGTLGIFGTLFQDGGGESFTLLLLRFLGTSAILVAVVLLRRRPLPSARDAVLSALFGAAALGATFCLFRGYEEASPGLVTLLFYIYPLIVTVAARVIFDEPLTWVRVALLGVGMVGIALTVGAPGTAFAAGAAWGLAAGVFVSMQILGGRLMMSRSVDSVQYVLLTYGGAAIALLSLAALIGASAPPSDTIGYAAALIVLASVAPTLLFYFAVHRIGAGAASRLATIEPVTAVVLAYVVFGDSLAAIQILGGLLVVCAVALLAAPPALLRRWEREAPRPATP